MKNTITDIVKPILSSFCLYVMSIDSEQAMSVIAFVVILVSNFARFKIQVKKWYSIIKNWRK